MKNEEAHIRVASPDDAEEILEIYAPYVKNTAISFEYDVPQVDEFRQRIRNTLKKYPYLVAVTDGEIVGYAYTGAFRSRAAYSHSVETTIYVKEDKTRTGIGRELYTALENVSKAQNIINLNACVASREAADSFLTPNSIRFHEHMGYQRVGEFHACGYKFKMWYNVIWMEKIIGEHEPDPAPVIDFPDLDAEIL